MNEQNQGILSAPEDQTVKRKRGDDNVNSGNESSDEEPNVASDELLLGQAVSGVLSGSFSDGYFVTVKPQNTDITLTGLVFCPGKVIPITPENDLAPKEIMYKRISPTNHFNGSTQQLNKNKQLVRSTLESKSESQNAAALMTIECDQVNANDTSYSLKGHELTDQGYEFGMSIDYNYPPVENLQDYRIIDQDEIMQEFEDSACMNAPSSKPADYRLDSITELRNIYPETVNNTANKVSEDQEVTVVDPCLKLMDSVDPVSSEVVSNVAKSLDVNERSHVDEATENPTRSTMEHVHSDLQLGPSKVIHSGIEDINSSTTVGKNYPDKASAALFFSNMSDASNQDNSSVAFKKPVTESSDFRLARSQVTVTANDSASSKMIREAVSSELKLSAASGVTQQGSIPSGDDLLHSNDSQTET